MASIVKIKRSSVQGKKPTTSEITGGELALNTRDGKLFSSDGSSVFTIGANLVNLSVTTSATIQDLNITGNTNLSGDLSAKTLTIGNNSTFTLPDRDGSALQIMQTDGSGTVAWVALEQAEGGGFNRGTLTSFPGQDLMTGGSGTETYIGSLGVGGTDAFGIPLDSVYDCLDPNGRLVTEDLGALT